MQRQTAIDEIKRRVLCTEFLEPSKNGMYCCPCPDCDSGHGHNATGAVKYYQDTNSYFCHACRRGGDVIELYRLINGLDFNAALSQLAERARIDVDPYRPGAAADFSPNRRSDLAGGRPRDFHDGGNMEVPATEKTPQEATERPTEAAADYMAYYAACRDRLQDPEAGRAGQEYLARRGISLATAAAYWIGFDPQADPTGAPGAVDGESRPHPCPRIIVPASRDFYCGRRTDGGDKFRYLNASREKGAGEVAIFNEKALFDKDARAVFVTEGAFDALSILEAGGAAIALNGAGNAKKLIDHLAQRRPAATLILALDADDRGRQETETIRAGLQRLNISYTVAEITGAHKDPAAYLEADRGGFIEAVTQAREAVQRPDNTSYYLDRFMTAEIERFKRDKKTGFANVDREIGGLYSGLYVLAAISSLGKTTFALQLADQLAEAGNDVIYFSLEQSRLELVTKSLARRTYQANKEKAVDSLSIRKGYLPQQVQDAAEAYKAAVADRLSIVEGNFACNVAFISDYVRAYIERTGERPVVFVDYLQILQPADDAKRSTKEAVDSTITELKQISRELDLTIFLISSVNRNNYLMPIDFESLKESGGIEYTCDVVWGLQLRCLNDDIFMQKEDIKAKRDKVKEAKAEDPRRVELVSLKNRYGRANFEHQCFFRYYPKYDFFEPQAADFQPEADRDRRFQNAKRL